MRAGSLSLPLPQPLGTTDLLSVNVDLPILDLFHHWSHTVCSPFTSGFFS